MIVMLISAIGIVTIVDMISSSTSSIIRSSSHDQHANRAIRGR